MKLIVKFESSLKTVFNSLKEKIKGFFTKLFKGKVEPVKIVDPEQLECELAFEKMYGIKPERIRQIIAKVEAGGMGIKMSEEKYEAYRQYQLKNSVNKYNVFRRCNYTTGLYEPVIVDIHNESVEGLDGPSLDEIKRADNNMTIKMLKEQASNLMSPNIVLASNIFIEPS
jgi:ribosomal protein L23